MAPTNTNGIAPSGAAAAPSFVVIAVPLTRTSVRDSELWWEQQEHTAGRLAAWQVLMRHAPLWPLATELHRRSEHFISGVEEMALALERHGFLERPAPYGPWSGAQWC
jgi:hypothetical protein